MGLAGGATLPSAQVTYNISVESSVRYNIYKVSWSVINKTVASTQGMLFIEKGYVYTNYLYETTVVLDRMSHFVVRQWETARRRIIANRPKQKQQYNKQHRPHDFFFLFEILLWCTA